MCITRFESGHFLSGVSCQFKVWMRVNPILLRKGMLYLNVKQDYCSKDIELVSMVCLLSLVTLLDTQYDRTHLVCVRIGGDVKRFVPDVSCMLW